MRLDELGSSNGHDLLTRERYNADTQEIRMNILMLCALVLVIGCATRPTLEQLENEASTTGDWTDVEWREELIKERLESTAPGCSVGLSKKCFEELSGIQCYCIKRAVDPSGTILLPSR